MKRYDEIIFLNVVLLGKTLAEKYYECVFSIACFPVTY